MPPHYNHGQLTEEQQKLVTDNLPFLWFYYKNKVMPRFKKLRSMTHLKVNSQATLHFILRQPYSFTSRKERN